MSKDTKKRKEVKEIDAKDLLAKFDRCFLSVENAYRGDDGHYSIEWCNDLMIVLEANLKAFDYSDLGSLMRKGSGLGFHAGWGEQPVLSLHQFSECGPEGDHTTHPVSISEEFADLVDRAIDEGDRQENDEGFSVYVTGPEIDELTAAMLDLIFLPDAFDLIASWLD